ncbi:hypothetical protein OG742_05150 [Streptomyces sp. NBC_00828]|uniref:hypothetical protein n=1 Tax=Streptomyces sp. NBC_00828 TaxID=2903678 RepID=UPI00386AFF32
MNDPRHRGALSRRELLAGGAAVGSAAPVAAGYGDRCAYYVFYSVADELRFPGRSWVFLDPREAVRRAGRGVDACRWTVGRRRRVRRG